MTETRVWHCLISLKIPVAHKAMTPWSHRLPSSLLYRIVRDTYRFARRLFNNLAFSLPKRVECNICGWRGRAFRNDAWHKHIICGNCRSDVRHRLLFAALMWLPEFKKVVTGKKVLHFAPEPKIVEALRPHASDYITSKFGEQGTLDLTDLHAPSDSFDVIIACDVLEYVSDDTRAFKEIWRVLRNQGMAILTVPQPNHFNSTYEDKSITSPEGRLAAFGLADHLRLHGADFPSRLEQYGFSVRTVSADDFDDATVKRYVLFPPELSSRPIATNHRKIFFATKISPRELGSPPTVHQTVS
jgi:SAM-dependent methyltransferase